MKNKELSKLFFEMANLLELDRENLFKIRAYLNAAQTLGDLTDDVEELIRCETLTELPGIGKSFGEKISEYCRTGKIREHEKLKTKFPPGVLELLQITGLGPKRVRFLYDEMKIDSIEKLERSCKNGSLRELKGWGAKIEENILKAIAGHRNFTPRMLISDAHTLAQTILGGMRKKCRSLEELVVAGSLRRWKETIGDIDFLCVSQNPAEVMGAFVDLTGVTRVLAQGETKASLIHRSGIQCDLRVVPPESFGAALLYFTGSKEHNVSLREYALKKGLTLNEYGVYNLKNKNKPVAGRTEEEIYETLGLQYIPPELRENRGELNAAISKRLPKLVEEKDIKGDLHNHTDLSDGVNTLEEMAERARKKGWEWFVSGDHSQSLKVAKGLTPETLLSKKKQIEKLNRQVRDFSVLLGSEVDILADGRLDYDEKILNEIAIVVASVHSAFKQPEEVMTRRIVSAAQNPYVHILGHLTGRLINRREPYAVDVQKVLSAARAQNAAMEINGQPERLDLYDVHAKSAAEQGIKIALTTDAHSVNQLDFMTYALATARRAWLTKEQVLNCLDLNQLLSWRDTRN